MEEKTFELIEKMYSEMQKGFSAIRSEMAEGFSEVRREMTEGFTEVRQSIVLLENKVDVNLKALYDGYQQNTESINRIEKKIDILDEKVDRHDLEIRVIKNSRSY
ncbi:MAG: hypothetical protein IMZ47_00560 [Firmicutes bacterium]|nr:hypothetical protein [Bacillota bacterium]